jgi:hypothetical protein
MKKSTEHDVMIRFSKDDWETFKSLCLEESKSTHGLIRKFVKNYIKKNEKGL